MSKARQLKRVFSDRWRYGVKRELLVVNILNILLPRDYVAVLSGVGAGSAEYVDENYSSHANAFDIVVLDRDMKIAAYIDVTGIQSIRDYDRKKGLCIGSWKIWKAEKFGITDKAWYVHVLADRISLRFIHYNQLKKHARFETLYEGYGWRGQFYCCDQKYWGSIRDFIKWLGATRIE